MKVMAKIEFKDGHVEEMEFKKPDDYFRFVHLNAKKIKIAMTDDIKRPEGTKG